MREGRVSGKILNQLQVIGECRIFENTLQSHPVKNVFFTHTQRARTHTGPGDPDDCLKPGAVQWCAGVVVAD